MKEKRGKEVREISVKVERSHWNEAEEELSEKEKREEEETERLETERLKRVMEEESEKRKYPVKVVREGGTKEKLEREREEEMTVKREEER